MRRDYSKIFDPAIIAEIAMEARRIVEPRLHVTRYDDTRFFVRSGVMVNVHYLVDLDDPEFPRGRCECMHYDCRIEPKLTRGSRPFRDTCKHVDRVKAELAHGRMLCEYAGIEFSVRMIPTREQYEHERYT